MQRYFTRSVCSERTILVRGSKALNFPCRDRGRHVLKTENVSRLSFGFSTNSSAKCFYWRTEMGVSVSVGTRGMRTSCFWWWNVKDKKSNKHDKTHKNGLTRKGGWLKGNTLVVNKVIDLRDLIPTRHRPGFLPQSR